MALFYQKVITSLLLLIILSLSHGERITKFAQVSPEKLNELTKLSAQLIELNDETFRPEVINESSSSNYTPIIFWHGMGDTAFGSINIERINLKRLFPDITILSVQIGANAMEDRLASYFSNANSQIDDVCGAILSNSKVKAHGSFNAIGFSQGAQLIRGLIQRCPLQQNGIRVKNFISLGGQHQGVFGLPNCMLKKFCTYIDYLLSEGAYEDKIQSSLIQAAYWHDPTKEAIYREKSIFIADLNNEQNINETYIDNLLQLDSLVLVQFEQDHMVIPKESSLFGFYEPGSINKIIPLEQSELFIQDKLGLKKLRDSSRLHQISVPGDHLQYKMSWFNDHIANVYLNN